MSDQKISALTNYTTPLSADVLPIVDTANTTTKKITWSNLFQSPQLVTPALGTPTSGVLTNATGLPAAAVVAGTFGAGSYVMNTSLTNPLYIGGTGTTSTAIIRSTSGAGTTGADIILQTGNNGGTEVGRVTNAGISTNALQSGARAYLGTGTQSIPNGYVDTKVTFDTKNWDTQSEFDITTNHRFTALVAGKYQVNTAIQMNSLPVNKHFKVSIYVNGSAVADSVYNALSTDNAHLVVSDIVNLGVGGYVEIFVAQDNTGALNLLNTSVDTYVSIGKIA